METKNKKISAYIINNKIQIEELMKDYTNYIYKVICNLSANLANEDIEEITLDVFLTIWKNKEKLDIDKKMSSYISGITKNLVKKKKRNIKINENIDNYEEEFIDLTNIELFLVEKEKSKIIENEINKRKKLDKEIFIKYYYEENKIKDIAKSLKITETKVKSILFRTRKKLGKILKERGYDFNGK